jgi:hypothetical protein
MMSIRWAFEAPDWRLGLVIFLREGDLIQRQKHRGGRPSPPNCDVQTCGSWLAVKCKDIENPPEKAVNGTVWMKIVELVD